MRIIVDGNDGCGKSTLVSGLQRLGYDVQDRGQATKMTDDPTLKPEPDAFYLILDLPAEVSHQRLAQAGKDLTERYHTLEDLRHYRQRFVQVAALLPRHAVIDASGSPAATLVAALFAIAQVGIFPVR